jgi:hypothetical protein
VIACARQLKNMERLLYYQRKLINFMPILL